MNTKRLFLLAMVIQIAFLLAACPKGKVKVSKVPPTPNVANQSTNNNRLNGVFYSLPRTIIRVTVPVVATQKTRARYSIFTPFFFPDANYIKSDSLGVKVGDPVIEVVSEPDPDEVYLVNIRSRFLETKTLFLDFSEKGILTQAKAESKDETFNVIADTAGKIIPAITSFGLRTGNQNLRAGSQPQSFDLQSNIDKLPDTGCNNLIPPTNTSEIKYCESLEEVVLKKFFTELEPDERKFFRSLNSQKEKKWYCYYSSLANTDNTQTEEQKNSDAENCLRAENTPLLSQQEMFLLFRHDNNLKTFRSDFLNALQEYFKLQEMVKNRSITLERLSQGSLTSEALATLLKEIDTGIKNHRNKFFIGEKQSETYESNFAQFIPDYTVVSNTPEKEFHLFYFDEKKGVCKKVAADNLEFDDNIITNECDNNKIEVKLILNEVKMNSGEKQLSERVKAYSAPPDRSRGFYYRIPANYVASIVQTKPNKPNKQIFELPMQIAQFGTVLSLPASTGGWEISYQMALNPDTGALKNFQLGTDGALQKSFVERLTQLTTDTLDKTDSVTRLERRKKILELMKEIKCLETGEGCD